MTGKEDLHRLVELLSSYECEQLASCVSDIAAGERFWEGDVAVFYNEYVKARVWQSSSHVGVVPISDEGIFAPTPVVKSYPDLERIQLSEPEYLTTAFTELLLQRRSVREYSGQPLSMVQLATLLRHGCGVTGTVPAYDYRRLPLRVFPSAGGLQSPEVYLFVLGVVGVSPGLYHYQPLDHVLESLLPGDHRSSVSEIAFAQPGIEHAAVVFVITGCYERLRWKYGPRAYRYMCLDAGFLSENIHLAGQCLALGVCAIAGFADDTIEKMIGADGRDEIALLLVSVGIPSVPLQPQSPASPPTQVPPYPHHLPPTGT